MATCDLETAERLWRRRRKLGGPLRARTSPAWAKLGYGTLGLVLVAVAVAGALLPGIPTVMPLLIGSYFLSKCSPRLRDRILDWRLFRRYRAFLDPQRPLSLRERAVGLGAMWISISISCVMLSASFGESHWMCWSMIALGLVGSAVIAVYRQPVISWR